MKNRNYGKLLNDSTIEFAPAFLDKDGGIILNPSEEQYREAGWLPVVDDKPVAPEGKYVIRTSKGEVINNAIHYIYETHDMPLAVKRYERVRLYIALVKAGVWDVFENWAAEQTIQEGEYAGVNVLKVFNSVVIIRDDHPMFKAYLSVVQQVLDLTDEAVAEILAFAEEA